MGWRGLCRGFPPGRNDHGWFFGGLVVFMLGSVVISFFGGVFVGFCQSVWYRSGEMVSM